MSARPIVHIEIPSNNHQQAKGFYRDLCDWEIQEVPFAEDEIYVTFKTGNVDVAFSKMNDTDNQAGDVLVYFHSDDLDADMARVKELGGRIVLERSDIEGYGALGIFLDPMGNRVAFWQSAHPS